MAQKIGNAGRTRNQIRNSKSRGSQMEYSIRDSLQPFIKDLLLTKEEGYVKQYDLVSHKEQFVIEAKRHRAFSWNELVGYLSKLEQVAPEGYKCVVVFQANRQPALVMARNKFSQIAVTTFSDYFEIAFERHSGTKNKGDTSAI